jgi:hypothetical protein
MSETNVPQQEDTQRLTATVGALCKQLSDLLLMFQQQRDAAIRQGNAATQLLRETEKDWLELQRQLAEAQAAPVAQCPPMSPKEFHDLFRSFYKNLVLWECASPEWLAGVAQLVAHIWPKSEAPPAPEKTRDEIRLEWCNKVQTHSFGRTVTVLTLGDFAVVVYGSDQQGWRWFFPGAQDSSVRTFSTKHGAILAARDRLVDEYLKSDNWS